MKDASIREDYRHFSDYAMTPSAELADDELRERSDTVPFNRLRLTVDLEFTTQGEDIQELPGVIDLMMPSCSHDSGADMWRYAMDYEAYRDSLHRNGKRLGGYDQISSHRSRDRMVDAEGD